MVHSVNNEEFEELAFEEQCKIVAEVPFAQRGELITRSQDPERLVMACAAEELYLMVREMDSATIPEIIQYAHVSQLQFIADFECWNDDMICKKGFLRWLEYLEEAGDDKLEQWLLIADESMLIAGFQQYVTVLKPYHEETVDDVIGDHPYFTIDGLYYVMIDEENMAIIQRALEVLFERNRRVYISLLEGIMSEIHDCISEEAFQLRTVRLSEKGFPQKESAGSIYRPLTPEEWERQSRRPASSADGEKDTRILVSLPALWHAEKLFFDDVMATFAAASPAVVSALYQELVWVSNKIIIVRGMEHFGAEQMHAAFAHVRSVLNIALEELSKGDIAAARAFVVERWIEYLFRWGITRLVTPRVQAERIIRAQWPSALDELFIFLDDPFGGKLRGLMQTCPHWYDPAGTSDLYHLRDIKTLSEARELDALVSFLQACFMLLEGRCFQEWHTVYVTGRSNDEPITLSTLIGTLCARFVLDLPLSLEPLSLTQCTQFLQVGFSGKRTGEDLRPLRKDLTSRFVQKMGAHILTVSSDQLSLLKPLFDLTFTRIEEEFGLLDPRVPIQTHLVHCMLVTSSKND